MYVAWLKDLRMADLPQVGGKNASLGEMIGGLSAAGIRVPGGFATTAEASASSCAPAGSDDASRQRIKTLDPRDVEALAAVRRRDPRLDRAAAASRKYRDMILSRIIKSL